MGFEPFELHNSKIAVPAVAYAIYRRLSESDQKSLECLNCGNTEPKPTYKAGKIRIQKCDNCGEFVSTDEDLFLLFRHFGSEFRSLNPYYRHKDIFKTAYSTLHKGNFISEKKRLAVFQPDELNGALNDINDKIVK